MAKTRGKAKSRAKNGSRKKMDAIAMLKADHRTVEELFEKYEKSRGKKADIARQICLELMVHTLIEEELFYPACAEAGVEEDMIEEAFVEHDGAKVLIAELREGSPDDDYYDAKVKVLSEEIKHHVKEEEQRGGIFAQIRDSELDLEALAEQMQARKMEIMAQMEKKLPPPMTRTMKDTQIERGQISL
ncbi:MAG: hemerythrin domain-containing protein [Rhodospirillaceae bacterium]